MEYIKHQYGVVSAEFDRVDFCYEYHPKLISQRSNDSIIKKVGIEEKPLPKRTVQDQWATI